jgi:hypothetical protein
MPRPRCYDARAAEKRGRRGGWPNSIRGRRHGRFPSDRGSGPSRLSLAVAWRVEGSSRCADKRTAMNVDYRLVARFQASRDRYEAARRALPKQWLADPRPQVQHLNDYWVSVVVRAREHQERITADS